MKSWIKTVVRTSVHTILSPLEARLIERYKEAQWPHVFIVGAPRSGTSLFYELLVTRYRFAFFSNLAHRFYKTPVAASWCGRSIIQNRKSQFRSNYGHISGWSAPNEGGQIWQRWFEDGPWTDESALPNLPSAEIRATLAAMSRVFDAPFVNKNVMHSNRLRLLQTLFPDCLILEMRRDPTETVRSIIRAQLREKGPILNDDQWWSVQPSNAGGADLIERACLQVTGVADDIARDTGLMGRKNHLAVDYSGLCADPSLMLDQVETFLSSNGVPMERRQDIQEHFPAPRSKPLDLEIETRIRDLLEQHRASW
ncbi:sulfotransferase [Pseudohalocynthiibacter sp. F2068]|jgi:Sulfotransferase family|uniref:sulfotransferase n=1 Tax=Pseudohalocynthiibacter sp. F2068 TaxID=2926418 RepID=UPI001FF4E1F4|nr:sulfotransferase [Pseudohalocynthiibacter sp. F2068]MCK0103897.1 sulfotransferase [Pseudohalocynthiibacter sp. F2068]